MVRLVHRRAGRASAGSRSPTPAATRAPARRSSPPGAGRTARGSSSTRGAVANTETTRADLVPPGAAGSYVSPTGEVRVRVRCTTTANFFASGERDEDHLHAAGVLSGRPSRERCAGPGCEGGTSDGRAARAEPERALERRLLGAEEVDEHAVAAEGQRAWVARAERLCRATIVESSQSTRCANTAGSSCRATPSRPSRTRGIRAGGGSAAPSSSTATGSRRCAAT